MAPLRAELLCGGDVGRPPVALRTWGRHRGLARGSGFDAECFQEVRARGHEVVPSRALRTGPCSEIFALHDQFACSGWQYASGSGVLCGVGGCRAGLFLGVSSPKL